MEKWKEIPGYDGKYEISTLGNVRCINYKKTGVCKVMKMQLSKHNYYMITLRQGGKNVNRSIHRLVGITWIPNPNNLPEIDHINSDPSDNRVENLRWCTKEENLHNPKTLKKKREVCHKPYSRNPLTEEKRRQISLAVSKPVIQMSIFGKDIREFKSIIQAGKETKAHPSAINKCCRGKAKSAGGYKWRYK